MTANLPAAPTSTPAPADPIDVITLARALTAAAATPDSWNRAVATFTDPRSSHTSWSWTAAGVRAAHQQIACGHLTAYTADGTLRLRAGGTHPTGSDPASAIADAIATAATSRPGGRDQLGMAVNRLTTDLAQPTGRRTPPPTYRDRVDMLRRAITARLPRIRPAAGRG